MRLYPYEIELIFDDKEGYKKFLGNNSIIFYNKLNHRNKKKVIDKFCLNS